MKKLFYALISVTLLFNAGSVYAEEFDTLTENGDSTTNATVGTVESPEYNIIVNWFGFVFDWKYDNETQKYGWKSHEVCQEVTYGSINSGEYDEEWYSDSNCTMRTYLPDTSLQEEDKVYRKMGNGLTMDPSAVIMVEDYSTGGYADVSLGWEAAQKYDYTTATFTYKTDDRVCKPLSASNITDFEITEAYTNSACTGEKTLIASAPQDSIFYEYQHESGKSTYTSGPIPANGKLPNAGSFIYDTIHPYGTYFIQLDLGVDETKSITTPTAGETIGTVTVTIETH